MDEEEYLTTKLREFAGYLQSVETFHKAKSMMNELMQLGNMFSVVKDAGYNYEFRNWITDAYNQRALHKTRKIAHNFDGLRVVRLN